VRNRARLRAALRRQRLRPAGRRHGWHGLDPGGCRTTGGARRLPAPGRRLLRRKSGRRDATRRPVLAESAVVAGPIATGALVVRSAVVAWPVASRRAVVVRPVAAGRSAVARWGVVACGPGASGGGVVARSAGAVVRGWADRALVADRRVVRRRHLARVAVARWLAAAALRGDRGRLLLWGRLAADRLRGSPVIPFRGRGAFAPRTTRTLGW
jgi:hypothetical protein